MSWSLLTIIQLTDDDSQLHNLLETTGDHNSLPVRWIFIQLPHCSPRETKWWSLGHPKCLASETSRFIKFIVCFQNYQLSLNFEKTIWWQTNEPLAVLIVYIYVSIWINWLNHKFSTEFCSNCGNSPFNKPESRRMDRTRYNAAPCVAATSMPRDRLMTRPGRPPLLLIP